MFKLLFVVVLVILFSASLELVAAAESEQSSYPTGILDVLNVESIINDGKDLAWNYEANAAIAAIAGIRNRKAPSVYLISSQQDSFWLSYLRGAQKEGGGGGGGSSSWLSHMTIRNVSSAEQFIEEAFSRGLVRGAVVYDPNVDSTSNVASTVAGYEDLIPVCGNPSSRLYQFVVNKLKVPVKIDFRGKFDNKGPMRSAKNEAYRWAISKYLLRPEKRLPEYQTDFPLGYFVDAFWVKHRNSGVPLFESTTMNHDYIVARQGFLFDLDPWPSPAPNDDPQQKLGSDFETLQMILNASYYQQKLDSPSCDRLQHIVGFPPWQIKYVSPHVSPHGGVATEWQFSKHVSSFSGFMDADACCLGSLANAQLYSLFPLKLPLKQNPPPTIESLARQGLIDNVTKKPFSDIMYSSFYAGDWDSAAWIHNRFQELFDDPNRGKVKIGWAIDPMALKRFPVIFDYVFPRLTPFDRLTSGDSGKLLLAVVRDWKF